MKKKKKFRNSPRPWGNMRTNFLIDTFLSVVTTKLFISRFSKGQNQKLDPKQLFLNLSFKGIEQKADAKGNFILLLEVEKATM